MPSPIIEQLRGQFLASLGISEYTPIPPEQEADLQDRWEQFLFAAAQRGGWPSSGGYNPYGGGSVWQPAPAPSPRPPARFVPDAERAKYQPGQLYTVGGATYIGPPTPGSVVGKASSTQAKTAAAPRYVPLGGASSGGGTTQSAPAPRR